MKRRKRIKAKKVAHHNNQQKPAYRLIEGTVAVQDGFPPYKKVCFSFGVQAMVGECWCGPMPLNWVLA